TTKRASADPKRRSGFAARTSRVPALIRQAALQVALIKNHSFRRNPYGNYANVESRYWPCSVTSAVCCSRPGAELDGRIAVHSGRLPLERQHWRSKLRSNEPQLCRHDERCFAKRQYAG